MKTTIYRAILGLYKDNGKMETTIYRAILGLYKDNGKENGNYYIGSGTSCHRIQNVKLGTVGPKDWSFSV